MKQNNKTSDIVTFLIVSVLLLGLVLLITSKHTRPVGPMEKNKCYQVNHHESSDKFLVRVRFVDYYKESIEINVLNLTTRDAFYSNLSTDWDIEYKEASCGEFSRIYRVFTEDETINYIGPGYIRSRDWMNLEEVEE